MAVRPLPPWFAFPLLGWGIVLAVHGVYAFVMKTPEEFMSEPNCGPRNDEGRARARDRDRSAYRAGQNAARGLYIDW